MIIRPATEADWPLIQQWQADHFAEMQRRGSTRPIAGQYGLADAVWVVLERNGSPVAVTAYTEAEKTRFGKAMFAAPGHVVDGIRLANWLEKMCDDQGYELVAKTDPENVAYMRVLLKRGFEITAVELVRRPR